MAHGKTLLMRNIRKPAPQWVHEHTAPTTAMRKADVLLGKVRARDIPDRCEPYTNPDRDLRMGRKNTPPPKQKPQNPKAPKGGSKGGRKGKG
jgi:hypothetical protein